MTRYRTKIFIPTSVTTAPQVFEGPVVEAADYRSARDYYQNSGQGHLEITEEIK